MITYTIRTDVKGKRTLETDAVFTTGDVQAYRLRFVFYDNGVYDATGCSLMVKGKRPDGVVVIDEGVVDELGNAFYDVKSSMYAVAGTLSLEVALLTETGGYLTVKELIISVREGFGEGELAEDAAPLLTELHNTLAEAKEITEKARPVVDIVAAEELRNKREEQRLQAEAERMAAELQREEAEGLRQAEEGERASAETERVAAETERQSGYAEMQNAFANALCGSASGSAIHLDDVSPVEHKAEVKIKKVNLLDISKATGINNTQIEIGTNTITIKAGSEVEGISFPIILKSGVNYTYSAEWGDDVVSIIGANNGGWRNILDNGYVGGTSKNKITTVVPSKNVAYVQLLLYRTPSVLESDVVISNIQIEEGTVKTDYCAYFENVEGVTLYEEMSGMSYQVNADGTTEEIQSLSPVMHFITDTEGARIECQYNKDTNKVIEKLTNAIISLGGNV